MKSNKRIILLCLLSVAVVFTTRAQRMSEAQMKQVISKTAAEMRTLQCDFVQTKRSKLLSGSQTAQGRMAYSRAEKLRWEYTAPFRFALIMDGKRVLMKDNRGTHEADADQQKVMSAMIRTMMDCVTGKNLSAAKDFSTAITAKGTLWTAVLTPKRQDLSRAFSRMRISFDSRQGVITEVALIERNGSETVIAFKNIKKNAALSASTFK